ncbi:MAG: polysaccharide deacetylase family protein [Planctomycetota bacterium]|nr:polysaccharide deacetylase family protein [Planctomycetota bacterium]
MEPTAIPEWPGGAACAVSLSFDDGMTSQLERAIPYLDRLGLRGTFYLNTPGDAWRERLEPWKAVVEKGHEAGNHTCSHLCSRGPFGREKGLETTTLNALEADILECERRLDEVLGKRARSFCYPCYDRHVGEGESRASYVPLIAKHFVAGRGKFNGLHHVNFPAACDLSCVGSHACERMGGHELLGLCERAANKGAWTVLTFHGILEGHVSVSEVDFRELCDHLARYPERFWVAPVVEVAQRIRAWRAESA